ncbi:MAG: DJ-1/PfpI family protein [Arenicella sp.]|nr:DJ-1/PfpI family protein [Arenicella sp.]
MKKILVPLPSYGFDPTEVAIPWALLSKAGFDVIFSTPEGSEASPDMRMLKGNSLGLLKPILQARHDAVDACVAMQVSDEFSTPLKYDEVKEESFDALLLPGGHDKGVKEYLESPVLQALVVDFFVANKPVAAICHGVVLAARSIDPRSEQSVIYDYKTTSLLKSQELLAYNLTRLWLGDYYLTYPGLTVEDDVKSALADQSNFKTGPSPLFRDSQTKLKRGFFVKDRNYLSARWPGDAYSFAYEFIKMLHA